MGHAVTVYFDTADQAEYFSSAMSNDANVGEFQITMISDVVEES